MNQKNCGEKTTPFFIVSGGKGIAAHTMVHSLIIQYPDHKFPIHVIPEIQTEEKVIETVQKVKKACGVIAHTMVNRVLRDQLVKECKKQNVKNFNFMGEIADFIENDLGYKSVQVPGLYRRINAQYYNRVEAIDFTLNHDDGLDPKRILEAEIVLAGVSRSGKTPLSIYMAMFGWKVANVPLVKGIEPPKELFMADPKRVFGLTISINQLVKHRYKRLAQMGDFDSANYIDERKIREEILNANMIYERGGFTKIMVTNKPIESSANEITAIISDRFDKEETLRENLGK